MPVEKKPQYLRSGEFVLMAYATPPPLAYLVQCTTAVQCSLNHFNSQTCGQQN